MPEHSDTVQDETEFSGAPRATERKYLKPFGMSGKLNQMMKEEALRTLPRQECFDRGYITVKDLDDEELRYGRCRDSNTGKIPNKNGKKTELIPRDKYDEMVGEHELRFKQKLRQRLDDMLDVIVDIATDDTVEPKDRFEAAKYVFERTAGKTPETVTVNVRHAPWEDLLNEVSGIAHMSRAEHRQLQSGIVDAELVDITEVDDGEEKEEAPLGEERGSGFAPYEQRMGSTHTPSTVPTEPATGSAATGTVDEEQNLAGLRVDEPDQPELNYGRRADEKRSYAEQAHAAQELAKRRKEARAKIQGAKKQRKISRALGADAIEDEITDATISEDGSVTFEQE